MSARESPLNIKIFWNLISSWCPTPQKLTTLKGAVSRLCTFIFLILPITHTSLFTMELILSKEIACKGIILLHVKPTCLSLKPYIKRYRQQENELSKTVRLTSFQKPLVILFNLLRICPSAPSFVRAVLFTPCVNYAVVFMFRLIWWLFQPVW